MSPYRVATLLSLLAINGACDAGAVDDEGDGLDDLAMTGALTRYDLIGPSCPASLLEQGAGCPTGMEQCLCRPEFAALNPKKGTSGNSRGRVLVIAQPRFGKRDDGTYVFDAYRAIKDAGNVVGHYVNYLNPDLSCGSTASWSGVACSGGSSCGWRCVTGSARADQIVAQEAALYAGYSPPNIVVLNEAWSLVYQDTQPGLHYRTWLLGLMRRLHDRGKLPVLYIQERHIASSRPFNYLYQMSQVGLLGVEAYLSGHEVMNAPNQCAAPFDGSNWCVQEYREMRNAIRNSASPAIPYERMIMIEHFAANNWHYTDDSGRPQTASWGRAYDGASGTPTSSTWNTIVARRAAALKALDALGGVGSYAWAGNRSGTGSADRVGFAHTYAGIELP